MKHFIRKHINRCDEKQIVRVPSYALPQENNTDKDKSEMNTENIDRMESLANELTPAQTTKKIKKEKGLIERIESEKTMLTEDNKQLLLG